MTATGASRLAPPRAARCRTGRPSRPWFPRRCPAAARSSSPLAPRRVGLVVVAPHAPTRAAPATVARVPAADARGPARSPLRAASSSATYSPMPSDADSPVERIAATCRSRGSVARELDHVVRAAPGGVATGRAQPGVGADLRGPLEAPGTPALRSGRISSAASASTDQSRLSSRSRAVGPAISSPSIVGNTSTPLPSFDGTGQQDLAPAARPPAPRRPGTPPCAGTRSPDRRPASRATSSACSPAQLTTARACSRSPRSSSTVMPPPEALASALTRVAQPHLGAARLRGARQRVREGDRIGDGLAGHAQRTVVARSWASTPLRARVLRQPADHGRLVIATDRREPRSTAPDGDTQLVHQLLAQLRRAQDQPRLELAGLGVKAGVQDAGVRSAGSQRQTRLGLEQHHASPRGAPARARPHTRPRHPR